MNMFNDNDGLKHPAFHDEKKDKKSSLSKILDFCFGVIVVLGFIAFALFYVWVTYFREN